MFNFEIDTLTFFFSSDGRRLTKNAGFSRGRQYRIRSSRLNVSFGNRRDIGQSLLFLYALFLAFRTNAIRTVTLGRPTGIRARPFRSREHCVPVNRRTRRSQLSPLPVRWSRRTTRGKSAFPREIHALIAGIFISDY